MADPVTMAIGGAAVGAMLDKKDPLRGAALGGMGGYFGGPLFGAAAPAESAGLGAVAGAAGASSTALTPSALAFAPEASFASGMGSGMGGSGMGLTAGNTMALNSSMLGSGASVLPAAGMEGGLAGSGGMGLMQGNSTLLSPSLALSAEGTAGQIARGAISPFEKLMENKGAMMGANMMMNQKGQGQGQPMPNMAMAPPAMRPQFNPGTFQSLAPQFNPVIGNMPYNNMITADPRKRNQQNWG